MEFVNNKPEQIKIRKSQNTLIVVGTGTVLFSIWSAVKLLSVVFLLRQEIVEAILKQTGTVEEIPENILFWVVAVMCIIFALVIMGIRTYVGLCAVAEGQGKRRSIFYIIIAVFMILLTTLSVCMSFFITKEPDQFSALTGDQSFSAMIIDATSVIMLTQMVVSALRIRQFNRRRKNSKGKIHAA